MRAENHNGFFRTRLIDNLLVFCQCALRCYIRADGGYFVRIDIFKIHKLVLAVSQSCLFDIRLISRMTRWLKDPYG